MCQRSLRGHSGQSLKIFKNSYLVCITIDEVEYKSCDLAFDGARVMVTDNGSKVIKGSFPVLS